LFRINVSLPRTKNRHAVDYRRHFPVECFVGGHTYETRQQIYSARDSSELDNLLGLEEISFLEAGLLEPELNQNTEKSPRILCAPTMT
jgi:hypothetical protein